MKYDPNQELIVATYADGGIVASVINSETDPHLRYHYMCAFESEKGAKRFVKENLNEPVFFTAKSMLTLAREFNCSIIYPGMAGIVYIDDKEMAEHIDVDALIKMAYKSLSNPKESYGGPLVVNNKIADVYDIDFNKKHFFMMKHEGGMMTKDTLTKSGNPKPWLVVTTTKALLDAQVEELGIDRRKYRMIKDGLSGLLPCFLPGRQFDKQFAGIMYIDKNGATTITNKKIIDLLKKRQKMLQEICQQNGIYLDAKYFLAANKLNGMPLMTQNDEVDYIVVSQQMDVMIKAFKLEGIDVDKMLFTNLLSLREIVESGKEDDYGGVAVCLDDNPDHMIYLTVKELYEIAQDGDGDEDSLDDMEFIYSDDEYMMAERLIMMADGFYIIAHMKSKDTGEMSDVIFMGENEDVMRAGLEETGYSEENDRAVGRPTYEIFAEFREGGQLDDCDGIMYFTEDGYCIIPKDAIVDALEEWEELTDKKSVCVEMDFDEYHCVAMEGYKPVTFTQPDGTTFVIVSKDPEYLEWALMELFGDDEDVVYDNSKTLQKIAEAAVFGDMGIAMCDKGGITFIEPKRLSQALEDEE